MISVSADDVVELERLVRSGKTEQRVVSRARIILCAADGLTANETAARVGTSRQTATDWRSRYTQEGMAGLLHDRPRGLSFPPLDAEIEKEVIRKTLHEQPPVGTHWSCRTMAKVMEISKNSVQRIWSAHGLKPHLVKTFKLSNDPAFVEKLTDVVGTLSEPTGARAGAEH